MNSEKCKIVVVYGGKSSEHDVSRSSFAYLHFRLAENMLRNGLLVSHVIYITREGKAVLSEYKSSKQQLAFENGTMIDLVDAFQAVKKMNLFVYSLMYGQNVEDGNAQGMVSFFSIHSNFGSTLSCALGMSKYHLNRYVKCNFPRFKVPETVGIHDLRNLKKELERFINREIVIKPNSLGSSVLAEKFKYTEDEYPKINLHIRKILELDKLALVQEYVKGIEYTLGCLEIDNQVINLPSLKVETKNNFLGYKEKYITGVDKVTVIKDSGNHRLLSIAKIVAREIFIDLGFQNAARFDLILRDNSIFFLEINPVPGIAKKSALITMLRAEGWDIEKLIEVSVDNQLKRKNHN